MTTSQVVQDGKPRFSSLREMKEEHRHLLELAGSEQLQRGRVLDFLRTGQETGTFLDWLDDRSEAQSLLDYWTARLYSRALRDPDATADSDGTAFAPDATLAPFDAAAVRTVADRAEAEVQGLEPQDRETAHRVLLQMVDIVRTPKMFEGRLATRQELEKLEDDGARVDRVLDRLQAAGALRMVPDAEGAQQFALRYDALTRQWPQLEEWLARRWSFRTAADADGQLPARLLKEGKGYHDLDKNERKFLSRAKTRRRNAYLLFGIPPLFFVALYVRQLYLDNRHATASRELALIASDPDPVPNGSSLQAAVKAAEFAKTEEAERALHSVLAAPVKIWDAMLSRRPGGIALSADGRRLASVQTDGSVQILDTAGGKPVSGLPKPPPPRRTLEVAFGRTRLATITDSGNTNEIDVWTSLTGKQGSWLPRRITTIDDVSMMSFSPDDRVLAIVGASPDIELWDTSSGGREILSTHFSGAVQTLGFSPDGKYLVVSGDHGELGVWDASTHALLHTLQEEQQHAAPITGLAFDQSDQLVTFTDGGVTLWSLARGTSMGPILRGTSSCQFALFDFAYSADGKYLALASESGNLMVWEIATGLQVAAIPSNPKEVEHVAFTPDDDLLVIAFRNTGFGKSTKAALWKLAAPSIVALGEVSQVQVWFKDAATLIAGNGLQLWEVSWPRNERLPRAAPILSPCSHFWSLRDNLAFSSDGSRIACTGSDPVGDMVEVWQTGSPVPTRLLRQRTASAFRLELSPDGSRLAVLRSVRDRVDSSEADVWDVDAGERLAVLPYLRSTINSVAFAPNNGSVAVAKGDGTVDVWNLDGLSPSPSPRVPDRRFEIHHGHAVYAVAYNPAHEQIATSADDDEVKLWDARNGRAIPTRMALHQEGARYLAFSPDGSRLASTGGRPGAPQVRLWDATKGRAILLIPGTGSPFTGISFSKDSGSMESSLLAMGLDGGVQLEVLNVDWLSEIARLRLQYVDDRRRAGESRRASKASAASH